MKFLFLTLFLISSLASAHEMTPAYPKLIPSQVDGLYKTTLKMFNKRDDVEFYDIGVFDRDFNAIPFVSSYSVFKIKYLGHVTFDLYIREKDAKRALYICSRSKLRKHPKTTRTSLSSKICSKIK